MRYKRRTLNAMLTVLRPVRRGLTTNAVAEDPRVNVSWETAKRYLKFLRGKGYVIKVKYRGNEFIHWVHYRNYRR